MSARRTAAVLALLAVCVGAWFACSSTQSADETAPPDSQAVAPPRRSEAPPAPRVNRRQRARETPPAAPAEPKGNIVRGQVLLRDGSPAVGARVRAWSVARLRTGDDAQFGGEVVAGDDGRFALEGADEGDQVVVYAVLAGHHTAFAPPPVTIQSFVTEVTIRFGEGGVLTGRVAGPMGKPAGRVEVRLRPVDRLAHTRDSGDFRAWSVPGAWEFYAATTQTDPDGRYRFDGVPLPRNGAPQTRVPVATVDGKDWAGEEVAFETDGQELERDIVIGETPWTDTPLPEPLKRRVTGRVLGPEDRPVAGATVTFLEIGGPRDVSWFGTSTQDDGAFAFDERIVKPAMRLEVRVAKKGFNTFRGPPPDRDETMTVRLTPATHAPLPGRIRGTISTEDDEPVKGPFQVTAVDEMYRVHSFWTWVGAKGEFVLEGLEPGEWRVFLRWNDPWQEATVTERGEALVELHSRAEAADFVPPPWTEEMAKRRDRLHEQVAEFSYRRRADATKGMLTDATEVKIEEAMKEVQALDASYRASLPVREVLVTGLPKDTNCVVVATDGVREWRSEAKDGVARFAGLSVEKWTLTLVRPGADDVAQEAEVVKGEGPQTVVFEPL